MWGIDKVENCIYECNTDKEETELKEKNDTREKAREKDGEKSVLFLVNGGIKSMLCVILRWKK